MRRLGGAGGSLARGGTVRSFGAGGYFTHILSTSGQGDPHHDDQQGGDSRVCHCANIPRCSQVAKRIPLRTSDYPASSIFIRVASGPRILLLIPDATHPQLRFSATLGDEPEVERAAKSYRVTCPP